MTDKEFLDLINNTDEKFLQESCEAFNGFYEETCVEETSELPPRSVVKKRLFLKPAAYTAALLAAVTGLSIFANYRGGSGDIAPSSYEENRDSDLIYGNISLNCKLASPAGGMICPSENGLYYSSLNNRGEIYCETDGESELVVDMPAYSINYLDGRLYFISPEDGRFFGVKDGNFFSVLYDSVFCGTPYSYDINTGELKKLADSNAVTSLFVTSEGIYYNRIANNSSSLDPLELWHADLDGNEPKKCGAAYPLRKAEELIDSDGVHSLTKDGSDIAEDADNSEISRTFTAAGACVYDKKLFTKEEGTINITDLADGSTKSYDIRAALNKGISEAFYDLWTITDYVVLDDDVYIAYDGSNLLKISLSDNGGIKTVKDNASDMIYTRLYTDGRDIYAICTPTDADDFERRSRLVRLDTSFDMIRKTELY
ncbi:MAG: hypothetical protein NC452_05905 [Eubacterium sp.]|nr:hypothetical protein [Eubacterium sp.]